VGRTIRLGGVVHTVVGVMPAGFAFPENDRYWTPLRLGAADFVGGGAPEVEVFGRLADGVTLAAAQAELDVVGRQLASVHAPADIRPRLQPYTHAFVEPDVTTLGWMFHGIQLLVSLLLVVVCVNVAIVTYARAVTRLGEITVRTALGASRARIVGQLFMESLVLAIGAAGLGLGLAAAILRQVTALVARIGADQVPFWFDFRLSLGTVAYAGVLVFLAAVIVGVVPALKATGGRVRSGLQQLSGGSAGPHLGRTWSTLIAAQVALAVAALPVAVSIAASAMRETAGAPRFAEAEFISGTVLLDRPVEGHAAADVDDPAFKARYAALLPELIRRLEADQAVGAVTFALRPPGQEPAVWIEVEGIAAPAEDDPTVDQGSGGHRVGLGRVDVGLFDAFDVPILAGRGFDRGDVGDASSAVIVNRSFVERIGGGANVLGRRLRTVGRSGAIHPDDVELGRWFEIVGVVADFPAWTDPDLAQARVYEPVAPGSMYPLNLAVRVRDGAAASYADRLRAAAADVDPWLRMATVGTVSEILRSEQDLLRIVAFATAAITLSVLLLSAAGVHALMTFTVARRRREIGIRAALGADPARVLRGVLARAARQVAVGAGVGIILAVGTTGMLGGNLLSRDVLLLLLVVCAIVLVVGLLAALGPARQGLRIQPIEALREL
jgi:putative ABC transport system permease protein